MNTNPGFIKEIPNADGFDIPVRIYGEKNTKTPILVMHGLESHSGWFWQSGIALSGMGHPVYLVDRQGSGMSEAPRGDCKNYNVIVHDVETVADYLISQYNHSKVIVLGHCFGAIPSTVFTMKNPEKVEALILSTPAIFTIADLSIDEKLEVFGSKITGKTHMIDTPIKDHKLFTTNPDYLNFIEEDQLKLTEATARFFFEIAHARTYIATHRKKITVPVFMATAGKDGICDNKKNLNFYNHIKSENKTHIDYPEAVHILEYSSEKDKFFGDLENWLNNLNTT